MRLLVGGIVGARRGEIDRGRVLGPHDSVFGILAAGELPRLYLVFRTLRRVDDPYVLRMLEIEISAAVDAVDRARDHPDVALVVGVGSIGWLGRGGAGFSLV